jgi:uncharacterized protein (DUF1330 family)
MHDGRIMSAYIIGRIKVSDPVQYSEYTKVTPAIIARFGGRFIARGGETATMEGPEETSRVVIIEFPALEDAKAFFQSEEYAEAKNLREGAAVAQFVAIDGVVPV